MMWGWAQAMARDLQASPPELQARPRRRSLAVHEFAADEITPKVCYHTNCRTPPRYSVEGYPTDYPYCVEHGSEALAGSIDAAMEEVGRWGSRRL